MPTTERTLLSTTTVVRFVRLLLLGVDADPEGEGRGTWLVVTADIVSRVVAGLPPLVGEGSRDPRSVAGEVIVSVVEATDV